MHVVGELRSVAISRIRRPHIMTSGTRRAGSYRLEPCNASSQNCRQPISPCKWSKSSGAFPLSTLREPPATSKTRCQRRRTSIRSLQCTHCRSRQISVCDVVTVQIPHSQHDFQNQPHLLNHIERWFRVCVIAIAIALHSLVDERAQIAVVSRHKKIVQTIALGHVIRQTAREHTLHAENLVRPLPLRRTERCRLERFQDHRHTAAVWAIQQTHLVDDSLTALGNVLANCTQRRVDQNFQRLVLVRVEELRFSNLGPMLLLSLCNLVVICFRRVH